MVNVPFLIRLAYRLPVSNHSPHYTVHLPNDGPKEGPIGSCILNVLRRIIVPHHDVSRVIVSIVYVEAGDSRSVSDKRSVDTVSIDCMRGKRVFRRR